MSANGGRTIGENSSERNEQCLPNDQETGAVEPTTSPQHAQRQRIHRRVRQSAQVSTCAFQLCAFTHLWLVRRLRPKAN